MLYVYFIYSLWRNVVVLLEYYICRLLNIYVIYVYLVSNSIDIKICIVYYIIELFIQLVCYLINYYVREVYNNILLIYYNLLFLYIVFI